MQSEPAGSSAIPDFDVIVIGAGHAGVEAAWAAARLGRTVAICTLSNGTSRTCPAILPSAAQRRGIWSGRSTRSAG